MELNALLSAAAAKSLQSCPTLCDPIDGSPPGSPLPWDSPGKNTGVGCHCLLHTIVWITVISDFQYFYFYSKISTCQHYITLLLNKASKNQHWKKYCAFTATLFSIELHVDTFKLFKCLKNILKTFIHLKTYDAFICKVSLFHLPLIRRWGVF